MSSEHSPARSKRTGSTPNTEIDNVDPLDEIVWGVSPIAAIINRSERATRHLIQRKLIDVTKRGNYYLSTRRRLLTSLEVM